MSWAGADSFGAVWGAHGDRHPSQLPIGVPFESLPVALPSGWIRLAQAGQRKLFLWEFGMGTGKDRPSWEQFAAVSPQGHVVGVAQPGQLTAERQEQGS